MEQAVTYQCTSCGRTQTVLTSFSGLVPCSLTLAPCGCVLNAAREIVALCQNHQIAVQMARQKETS